MAQAKPANRFRNRSPRKREVMPGDHQGPQRPRNSDEFSSERRPIVQPRSPRQALVPDQLPPPPSRRARHPLVMIGNAFFTGLLLLIFAGGVTLYLGRHKLTAAREFATSPRRSSARVSSIRSFRSSPAPLRFASSTK